MFNKIYQILCQWLVLIVIYYVKTAVSRIESHAELSCNFEQLCVGWRNGSNAIEDQTDWLIANTGVFLDPWHSIPRPFEGQHFSYVLGSNKGVPKFSWLVSDTIPCLLVPGYLTFHYWKNTFLSGLFRQPLPRLQIFIRQPPTTQNLELIGDFKAPNSWGWRFAAFEIPASDQEFQIVIQAEYQATFDIIGIDDIAFRGVINENYCSLSPEEKQRLLQTTGLGMAQQQQHAHASNTIDSLLHTAVSNNNSPVLRTGQSALSTNAFAQLPPQTHSTFLQHQQPPPTLSTSLGALPTNAGPNNGQTAKIDALLTALLSRSPQLTEHQLSLLMPLLRQRLLAPTTVKRNLPPSPLSSEWQRPAPPPPPKSPVWPPEGSNFSFQQSNSNTAVSRPSEHRATTLSPSSSLVQAPHDPPAPIAVDGNMRNSSGLCPQVNCGFENSPCEYEGTDDQLGAWVIVQGRIGNPITGIPRAAFGRFYSVAYTNEGVSTQVLRSAEFHTHQQSFLTFWYYFANADDARLVVCDVRLDNCFWEKTKQSVRPDSRRWRRGAVVLPPGKHQIMFVVEQLGDNYYVGIDEIYLRTQINGDLVSCTT